MKLTATINYVVIVMQRRFDQPELNLETTKRICSLCKQKEIYLDIKTMNYCEDCLYELVQNQ